MDNPLRALCVETKKVKDFVFESKQIIGSSRLNERSVDFVIELYE